jgi:N-acetylglucosaminyl-diphospho-decaprenol L-rhamnosyltransferase
MASVAVIVVTHDSEAFFADLLSSLEHQTLPVDSLIIVDSGSTDRKYLQAPISSNIKYTFIQCANIGFSEGNNLAWKHARGFDYVFFLNPDAFPDPNFVEEAIVYMESSANGDVGALTGSLLGYDISNHYATGLVDSTGITRSLLGHLADRDQGSPVSVLGRYSEPNLIPGICGAVLFCRQKALLDVAPNGEVFDPRFFMYKEDVDLTWRIRKAGWKIVHHPDILAYHCRGWKKRSAMPRRAKLNSARNEVLLYLKHPSIFIVRALIKYVMVTVFDL